MIKAHFLVFALSVVTLVAIPVDGARAQGPDFEAVGSRLLRAVSDGELSPHQAREMMATLARVRFEERLAGQHAAGRHHVGAPSVVDARRFEAEGFEAEGFGAEGLEAGGLEAGRLDAAADEAAGDRPAGDKAAGDEAAGEASGRGIPGSLVEAYAGAGVSIEDLDRLRDALAESGVRQEQMPATLGAMLRVIHVTATGDGSIDLAPRIRSYLVEQQGLEVEQFQLAHRLALRVGKILRGSREAEEKTDRPGAGGRGERGRRVGAEVIRGRITNDAALAKVEAARAAQRQREAPWGSHLDLERGVQPMSVAEYERRMVRAVEAGKLPEAAAGEALRSYRAELDARGIPALDHEQLKRELDAQVSAGALSREEAAARFRAVLEKAAASRQRDR